MMDKTHVDEIMQNKVDRNPGIHWDDIEGLEDAKQILVENIVYP